MSNYLELPFKIKSVNASESIDADFGPYESVADANSKIPSALRKEGKMIGIYSSGELSLFAYQGGIGDMDLKPVSGGCVKMTGQFEEGTLFTGKFENETKFNSEFDK